MGNSFLQRPGTYAMTDLMSVPESDLAGEASAS